MVDLELAHRRPQRARVEFGRETDRERGQDVGKIVPAEERNLARRHDLDRPRIAPRRRVRNRIASYVQRRHAAWRDSEPERARGDALRGFAFREAADDRVVEVADEDVARTLIREDAKLRFAVFVHRMVTVEMIGREVQDRRDPGFERADRFELKRRHFCDHPIACGRDERLVDERVADVPADARRLARAPEHRADQRRRRRLALGPRNRDHRRLPDAIGDFDFRKDRHASRLHAAHERAVERDARRKHAGRQLAEERRDGLRLDESHLRRHEARDRRFERRARFFVGRVHGAAARAEHLSARDAAAPETDHEHALARVERSRRTGIAQAHRASAAPASDNNADAVQKRAVTLVSGQPPSSK